MFKVRYEDSKGNSFEDEGEIMDIEITEALERYSHEITIKKVVRTAAFGYGREVKYIKRLDILCHECIDCGENDIVEISASECIHSWKESRKNIYLQVADSWEELDTVGIEMKI